MNQALRGSLGAVLLAGILGGALAQEAATPSSAPAQPAPPSVRPVAPGEYDKLAADKSLETWFISKVMVSTPVRRGGFYTVCMQTVFVPRGTYSLPAQVERQIEAASGMANQSGDLMLRAGSTLIANRQRSSMQIRWQEMNSIGMALVSPRCGGQAVVYQ